MRSDKIKFISSFNDMNGNSIKEGDILFRFISEKRDITHLEERYDIMQNSRVVRIKDYEYMAKGWILHRIEWNGDCLCSERIKDFGGLGTFGFDYLNCVYESDKELIIGNVHDGWDIKNFKIEDYEKPII